MTFRKGRRGAINLSLCAVGVALLISAGFAVLDLITMQSNSTQEDATFMFIASLVFMPIIAAVATLLVSVIIYQLDERHYGKAGAWRWAIVGAIYGIWWGIGSRILPEFNNILDNVLRFGLQIILVIWAYWLVFRLFPPASAYFEEEQP